MAATLFEQTLCQGHRLAVQNIRGRRGRLQCDASGTRRDGLLICVRIPIFGRMFKSFEFCLPTNSTSVPSSPDWFHEIKFDGYRLRVERNGDRARLITRGGYDWTKRFPWIVEAALKNRQKHFVIDGEAVILGVDGYSDFNALHSGKHNEEVQLCAFDVLAMDGDDLRDLPLSMRKANLARLLARRPDGIFMSDFEQGEIGNRARSIPEGVRVRI
jgi:bifunctional non-homologous end joining protein LigD